MNYLIPFLFLVQGDYYVENEPPKQEEKEVDESCKIEYDPRNYSIEAFTAPYSYHVLKNTKPVCKDKELEEKYEQK